MNLAPFAHRLPDHINAKLADAVAVLESGVDAGVVRNADFVSCKETINWAVDKAYDHYQDEHRDYGDGPLVMGAYNVPSAIKYATKNRPRNYLERLAVLKSLLPLHELIQAAKPLVVKRQTGPGAPKTEAQLEREAATMTCQCCGQRYLANVGTIAHHGYQRPGGGWQTASCDGAKAVPFEVGRDRLGLLIGSLKSWETRAVAEWQAVKAETRPVTLRFPDRSVKADRWGQRPYMSVDVTRDTFDAIRSSREDDFRSYSLYSFDSVKESDLIGRDRQIKGVRTEIKEQQARYDGWKKTHRWNGDTWVAGIEEAV